MSFNVGNTKIGSLYLGSTKIASAYLGNVLILSSAPSYSISIRFKFSSTSYTPSANLISSYARGFGAHWEEYVDPVFGHAGYWDCIIPLYTGGASSTDMLLGVARAFASTNDTGLLNTNATGGVTCTIDGISGDLGEVQTIDRLFIGCNAVTSLNSGALAPALTWWNYLTNVSNVNQAFSGCTGVSDGSAYDVYYAWSQKSSITNHSGTFSDCGPAQYLSQIPVSWGGTKEPTSTIVPGTLASNKAAWLVADRRSGDWGLFLNSAGLNTQWFTSESVSSYAGVSMNRSRLYNKINSFDASSNGNEYYRPAFVSRSGTSFNPTSSSTLQPDYILTTASPNGTLLAGTSATDMPGTLSYESYGNMTVELGSIPSSPTKTLSFVFLVTNTNDTSQFSINMPMAFLYNGNFKSSVDFKLIRE